MSNDTMTDRQMLEAIMREFDTCTSSCPRCGYEDEIKEMDAAVMLREHLAKQRECEPVAVSDNGEPTQFVNGIGWVIKCHRLDEYLAEAAKIMREYADGKMAVSKTAHPAPSVEVTDEVAYKACKVGRITRDEPSNGEVQIMKRRLEWFAALGKGVA